MSIDWGYIKYILRKTRRCKNKNKVPEILYYEALVVKTFTSTKLMYESQSLELDNWLNSVDVTKLDKNSKLSLVRSRELGVRKIGIREIMLCLLSYLPYYLGAFIVYLLSESSMFWKLVVTTHDILGFAVLGIYIFTILSVYIKIVLSISDIVYATFKSARPFMDKHCFASQYIKCNRYATLDTVRKELFVHDYELTYQELCDLDMKLLNKEKQF